MVSHQWSNCLTPFFISLLLANDLIHCWTQCDIKELACMYTCLKTGKMIINYTVYYMLVLTNGTIQIDLSTRVSSPVFNSLRASNYICWHFSDASYITGHTVPSIVYISFPCFDVLCIERNLTSCNILWCPKKHVSWSTSVGTVGLLIFTSKKKYI